MRLVFAYVSGIIFGLGISLSGMANPAKVLNFFDLAGTWDPSLAFVMGGGLIVSFFGFRAVLSKSGPMYEGSFGLPTRTDIDKRLVVGSLIFGVGWGIAGFCPGGALPVLGIGNTTVVMFVAAVAVGMIVTSQVDKAIQARNLAS